MSDNNDLRARIEAARNRGKTPQKTADSHRNASGAAAAFGHSVAMLVAVAVGGIIGYWIDIALGTRPWALLIFLVFGMVAGFLNIIRAANQMAARAQMDQTAQDAPDESE